MDIGARTIAASERASAAGLAVSTTTADWGTSIVLSGSAYTAKVDIAPRTGLSLELSLVENDGRKSLTYSIDTDLYPVNQERYLEFVAEVDQSVADLLDAVVTGRVFAGRVKGKPALLLPSSDGGWLLVVGGWVTTDKRYQTLAAAQSRGTFERLG
jgi:hypothetical protein